MSLSHNMAQPTLFRTLRLPSSSPSPSLWSRRQLPQTLFSMSRLVLRFLSPSLLSRPSPLLAEPPSSLTSTRLFMLLFLPPLAFVSISVLAWALPWSRTTAAPSSRPPSWTARLPEATWPSTPAKVLDHLHFLIFSPRGHSWAPLQRVQPRSSSEQLWRHRQSPFRLFHHHLAWLWYHHGCSY